MISSLKFFCLIWASILIFQLNQWLSKEYTFFAYIYKITKICKKIIQNMHIFPIWTENHKCKLFSLYNIFMKSIGIAGILSKLKKYKDCMFMFKGLTSLWKLKLRNPCIGANYFSSKLNCHITIIWIKFGNSTTTKTTINS